MNFVPVYISLPGGYQAKLMFRQYQRGGDWICMASDEYITDLQDLLDGNLLSWQDIDEGVQQ